VICSLEKIISYRGTVVSEVLVRFTEPTRSATGELYWSRAMGKQAEDGLWDGWLEFSREGDIEAIATDRETKQPNRADLLYWAEGLTDVYLEGALARAIGLKLPRPSAPSLPPMPPSKGQWKQRARSMSTTPATTGRLTALAMRTHVVLDPFATYAEGEELLHKQLHALSHDHLQNIVEAYQMSDDPEWARRATEDELVEKIVETVRASLR
jgi:hypothetical protein